MMRPTTASAGKVIEKKPGSVNGSSKRSGSVSSTMRRKETSLPPPNVRREMEGPKEVEPINEPIKVAAEDAVVPPAEETIPVTREEPKETVGELSVDTSAKESNESDNQDSSATGNEEDEGHTPTTTASSTTLVQEGDAHEVTAKE
jgi:hypothetical protein